MREFECPWANGRIDLSSGGVGGGKRGELTVYNHYLGGLEQILKLLRR